MKRPLTYALVSLPGAVMSIHLTGCSLIGLGIGGAVDSQPAEHLVRVPIDSEVTLYLRDGGVRRGRLVELGLQPSDVYQPRYARWREFARDSALPRIDDRVLVRLTDGAVERGHFVGFGIDFVALLDDSARVRHVGVEKSQAVESGPGRTLPGARLLSRLRQGKIPVMSTITISSGSELTTVTTDEIGHIKHSANGRTVGFLVGLAVDVALVAAANSAADNSNSSDFSGCQSNNTGYLAP